MVIEENLNQNFITRYNYTFNEKAGQVLPTLAQADLYVLLTSHACLAQTF